MVRQYCPVCGSEDLSRERHYGNKPPREERYIVYQNYDYCIERAGMGEVERQYE